MQKLNTDFASICICPKPSGAPLDKVPLQVVKEFEHKARQGLCTLNFSAAFNQVLSECNLIMKSCRDSIKATGKCLETQIQKSVNPERASRNGYTILRYSGQEGTQQRALVCQSKALSHVLQREMYSMGNAVLIRREAEMSHLQANLGDT